MRKVKRHFSTSGAEDILNVAYRLEQVAAFRDREHLQKFIPTSGWLKEQAALLRHALRKEGLDN